MKRSVRIAGHPTSISLEPEFWAEITRIAGERGLSINALVTEIDARRTANLSSALRVFVLNDLRAGRGVTTA
ncbi:MAG: ribbon-helix-helix domain-containing protein [Rhodospirillales bacterium]|jgi:predicted DNA-binding ribbon-helix-helix protein